VVGCIRLEVEVAERGCCRLRVGADELKWLARSLGLEVLQEGGSWEMGERSVAEGREEVEMRDVGMLRSIERVRAMWLDMVVRGRGR
jgi:hypothetical protein